MRYFVVCLFLISTLYSFEYVKYENIVLDEKNKLMWQDNVEVNQYLETFKTAPVYCENLVLNGYIDWRVPSIDELINIVDITQNNNINKKFHFVKPDFYASKSTFIENEEMVWKIDFKTGKIKVDSKNSLSYIRCVRDVL